MNISVAEAIQIVFGAIQIVLAWMTIRRQSEPQKASSAELTEARRSTSFISFITRFDAFALAASFGSLLAATFVQPDFLLPWAQTILSYFFIALSATTFTLTVVRVQAERYMFLFTQGFKKAMRSEGSGSES
jgi:hypothetical protein